MKNLFMKLTVFAVTAMTLGTTAKADIISYCRDPFNADGVVAILNVSNGTGQLSWNGQQSTLSLKTLNIADSSNLKISFQVVTADRAFGLVTYSTIPEKFQIKENGNTGVLSALLTNLGGFDSVPCKNRPWVESDLNKPWYTSDIAESTGLVHN